MITGATFVLDYLVFYYKRVRSAYTMLEHAQLEAVYIYFDTATYDEIERDQKVCLHKSKENIFSLLHHLFGH